jgi:hypothetical protein
MGVELDTQSVDWLSGWFALLLAAASSALKTRDTQQLEVAAL